MKTTNKITLMQIDVRDYEFMRKEIDRLNSEVKKLDELLSEAKGMWQRESRRNQQWLEWKT